MNGNKKDNNHTVTDDHRLFLTSHKDEGDLMYEGNPIKEKVMAVLGACAVTGLVAVSIFINVNSNETEIPNIAPLIVESIPKPPDAPNPFYTLGLEAKSAIVYDINNDQILFGVNENKQAPLASLTKLMTALLAVETFDTGTHIAIIPDTLATEGDSGLFANETWKVGDLVSFTMLSSSNDGADALAAAAGSLWTSTPQATETTQSKVNLFVDKMNMRAKELGLTETKYTNPTGLDEESVGGLGTANDMARLMTYIWEHEPDAIYQTNRLEKNFISEDNLPHKAENTNEYVNTISGLRGSKTGYTDLAGGNLAIVYDAGMDTPFVIVVLGSSLQGRFNDVSLLVDATSEYIESGWYEYEKTAGSTSEVVSTAL